MKKATLQLESLACPSCVLKIENAMKSLKGVDKDSVKVLFNSSKAKFDFDEEQVSLKEAEDAITALGYEVKKSSSQRQIDIPRAESIGKENKQAWFYPVGKLVFLK